MAIYLNYRLVRPPVYILGDLLLDKYGTQVLCMRFMLAPVTTLIINKI